MKSLLKSRKVLIAILSLVTIVFLVPFNFTEEQQSEIITAITVIGSTLIGGIALEDHNKHDRTGS